MADPNKNNDAQAECPPPETVADYLAEELPVAAARALETHAKGCARCGRLVAELKEVIWNLKGVGEEPLARDLAPEILSKIEDVKEAAGTTPPSAAGPRAARPFSFANVAAALLLSAAVGLVAYYFVTQRPVTHIRVLPRAVDETSVTRALDWLASAQEDSGAWDAKKWGGHTNYTVGLTALAVLAFMDGAEKPLDGKYAPAVTRGIGYLAKRQEADGSLSPPFSAAMYNHGLATVALLRAYALTGDEKLSPVLDRALVHIRRSQQENGGWGYADDKPGAVNTPISSWPLHALLMARRLGWKDTKKNIDRGFAWLAGMVDSDGNVGYARQEDFPNGRETLNAMGTLYLALRNAGGVRARRRVSQVWGSLDAIVAAEEKEKLDYYRCYYLTHALFAARERRAPKGLGRIEKLLAERQVKAGAFSGSWEAADAWSVTGGRIYATSLAVLAMNADRAVPELRGRTE